MEKHVNELLIRAFVFILNTLSGTDTVARGINTQETIEEAVIRIISELTYSDMIKRETTLSEAGLSSMTTIVLVGELKKILSGLRLSARDCSGSISVGDLVELINGRINESKTHPDLALTNRTSVYIQDTGGTRRSAIRTSMALRGSVMV